MDKKTFQRLKKQCWCTSDCKAMAGWCSLALSHMLWGKAICEKKTQAEECIPL